MLARKINGVPVKISSLKAFSLVEILISLGLGSILLLSFTYFYSNYYVTWQKQKEQLLLLFYALVSSFLENWLMYKS